MSDYHFNTFTDRQKIIALFQKLYNRDPQTPQQLLPILVLQAPKGGGVSMLIELLLECSRSALPHAYLDFAQSGTAVMMTEMLQSMCIQFRQSGNTYVKKLPFSRCELGISAVLDQINGNDPSEIRKGMDKKIVQSLMIYEQIDDLINAVANWFLPLALVLVLFKWLLQISEKSSFLRTFVWGAKIQWYKKFSRDLRLPPNVDMADILVTIRQWSRSTQPKQRQTFVENMLFDAFLEDLCEEFDKKRKKSARDRTTNAVLFLDNFDVALADGTGNRFLSLLAKKRLEGQVDPLLVVIGSHQRLFDVNDPAQSPPFAMEDELYSGQSKDEYAQTQLTQWNDRLHLHKGQPSFELSLCLPLWLHDFSINETTTYLLRAVGQGQLSTLEYNVLVEEVQRITHGHPLALSLIAHALREARTHGRDVTVYQIMQEPISGGVLLPTREQKNMRGYLLSILLSQLSEAEQDLLTFCSAPNVLDLTTIQIVLGLDSEKEARDFWKRWSKFNFVRVHEGQKMTLHPLVRDLLTQHLADQSKQGKQYYTVAHDDLRTYFSGLAMSTHEQEQIQKACIEEAYHTLALGNPNPAVAYICSALTKGDDTWISRLKIIEQAPTVYVTEKTKRSAFQILLRAKSGKNLEDTVKAIVLYSWFLNAPDIDIHERTNIYYELSEAYRYLSTHNQKFYHEIANSYFKKASALMTEQILPLKGVDGDPRIPTGPFEVRKVSKIWRNLRAAAAALLILTIFISYLSMYYGQYANRVCNPDNLLSPRSVISSVAFSYGMRVTHAPDGECIGMSDGSFAFDVTTDPVSGMYKTLGAKSFSEGDMEAAHRYWEEARHEDPSDAETLIYEENQNVMSLVQSQHLSYVTLVVLTLLTSSPENQKEIETGRSALRGFYLAQKDQNSNFKTPLLRIIIANAGDSAKYVEPVTQQIIQIRQHDKTIVGVLGPSQSRKETLAAVKTLGDDHIPSIAATPSSDAFTNISPYFFRVSPTNRDQVNRAIEFAETRLGVKTAVLFEDPNDNYSSSLSYDFIQRFQLQDHHTIFKTELYNASDNENVSNIIASEINNACTYNPDLIYFSGRADTMLTLLNNLPFCGKNNTTKLMGADELDHIISEPGTKFPLSASNRLYYTSFASPYEWSQTHAGLPLPQLFFEEYQKIFAANARGSTQSLLPNGPSILGYDATNTLLYAITNTVNRVHHAQFSSEDLLQSIRDIHGDNALQGVSGVIDFGAKPDGNPVNKAIVILSIDDNGNVMLATTLNRLQK